MSVRIRRVELEDLPRIANLWQPPQREDKLRWLWTDPDNNGQLNAFVAVDGEGNLKGVIAYSISSYSSGRQVFESLFPHSWKIEPGYKGFTGIALMKTALSQSKVSVVIGGTNFSNNLYPLFKFKKVLTRHKFYTVFKPHSYYKCMSGPAWRRAIKTISLLPSVFMSKFKTIQNTSVRLSPFDGDVATHNHDPSGRIEKTITRPYIEWIKRCPDMETYVFNILDNNLIIGFCILLIATSANARLGRIAHLSFLGENPKRWRNSLDLILHFFKKQNCCAVSTVATERMAIKAHSGIMQKFFITEPVLVRDLEERIPTTDLSAWHIQFSEGDTAFLRE
jgi:hypothetical protein